MSTRLAQRRPRPTSYVYRRAAEPIIAALERAFVETLAGTRRVHVYNPPAWSSRYIFFQPQASGGYWHHVGRGKRAGRAAPARPSPSRAGESCDGISTESDDSAPGAESDNAQATPRTKQTESTAAGESHTYQSTIFHPCERPQTVQPPKKRGTHSRPTLFADFLLYGVAGPSASRPAAGHFAKRFTKPSLAARSARQAFYEAILEAGPDPWRRPPFPEERSAIKRASNIGASP